MQVKREKIEQFEKKLIELEKSFDLKASVSLEFPQYKVLPNDLLLALAVLESHEYKFMISYKKVNNDN